MNSVLIAMLSLGATAALLALILFFVSKKFVVIGDERQVDVQALLPGINCGACGFAGCGGFASALLKAADKGDLADLRCPPGGQPVMDGIGAYFGLQTSSAEKVIAVLRCGGSCQASSTKVHYQGPVSCTVSHGLFAGEGGCSFGCLGQGDCVDVCKFDALSMNAKTGLPEIDAQKCTGCGACLKVCPRTLFFLRGLGKRERRVWINCSSTEKGALARKNCDKACIGCAKCVKVCEGIVGAISLVNNLAQLDPDKCIACGKCVPVCPTAAIMTSFELVKSKLNSIDALVTEVQA